MTMKLKAESMTHTINSQLTFVQSGQKIYGFRSQNSLVFTFVTLVLKISVLPWEVPIAPSGSRIQSVMDLFTKEYFPMSVLSFPALIFQ